MPKASRLRGFTLVEILVVVVILGILAAMSLPLYGAFSSDTRRTATEFTVVAVQRAIDLYRVQVGKLPDLRADWSPLTGRTVVGDKTIGPLLMTPPRNQMVTSVSPSSVIDGAEEIYVDQAAFAYDYQDGQGTGRLLAAMRPHP